MERGCRHALRRRPAGNRSLVAKSHKTGKPIRFWGSPDTVNAWETFRELGIDIINTDRPEACTLYFQGALTGRFSLSEE